MIKKNYINNNNSKNNFFRNQINIKIVFKFYKIFIVIIQFNYICIVSFLENILNHINNFNM